MKFKTLLLLMLVIGLVNAQLNVDNAIQKYLNQGEDYSALEIVYQNEDGTENVNTLVIVRDTPVFVVNDLGQLIDDDATILSVSQDFVNSRPPGVIVANPESIAASIIDETNRRKTNAGIRQRSADAINDVNKAKSIIEKAKIELPGADFSTIEMELNYYKTQAEDISTSLTISEAQILSSGFYSEFRGTLEFAQALNRSLPLLKTTFNNAREAREKLNNRIVAMGREDPEVVESQAELQEIEELLSEEIKKIIEVNAPDENTLVELSERSDLLVVKLSGLEGGGFDFITLAAGILAIILIIYVVVFYFKKLRQKQEETI